MPEAQSAEQPAPAARQYLTVALLVVGYAGYYLCRSDPSVAMPLLIRDLGLRGIRADAARITMGAIASWGVFAYAAGKVAGGWLGDFLADAGTFWLAWVVQLSLQSCLHYPGAYRCSPWRGSATGRCSRWGGLEL